MTFVGLSVLHADKQPVAPKEATDSLYLFCLIRAADPD